MTAEPGAVVVVPAHNEVNALPRCLIAIRRAAAKVALRTSVVVVLDACDDASIRLAGRYGPDAHFLQIEARKVGAARAAGFRYARTALGHLGQPTWYATTDADTQVGSDWLLRQLAWHVDVVLGVVRVDHWRHHSEEVAELYETRYDASRNRHIHGANMGFRSDAYWRVGGFAALVSGEDVDLVERFEGAGCRIKWDDELSVTTSDRRNGRAPGGFADHLAEVSQRVCAERNRGVGAS